jgi:hypothetical protein
MSTKNLGCERSQKKIESLQKMSLATDSSGPVPTKEHAMTEHYDYINTKAVLYESTLATTYRYLKYFPRGREVK